MTMISGVMGGINGTPPLGNERPLFYREAGTGMNVLAYFIAKNIFDLWNIFKTTFMLLMIYFVMSDPPGINIF